MFKANDYVVYSSTGVCQISDIRKDEYSTDNENLYYVLSPVGDGNMIIRVAVNKPNLAMRLIMTKDEVVSLIKSMPSIESDWIDDEKARNVAFKAALKSGNNAQCLKVIKTIYQEKKTRTACGRKVTKIDQDLFNAAEKILYQEFSIALNIPPEQVGSYIREYIPH